MKKASRVLLALALFMCAALHWADNAMAEKQPYRHFLALGATQPVSNAEENRMSPLIMYNWFMEDFPNDLYAQFGLTTTRVFFIFGIKNDSLFAGIKPQYNHSIYGGFHAYNTRGELDQTRIFKGNNMGAELFVRYNFISSLSAFLSYYPGYCTYKKYKEEDGFPFDTEETLIDLPDNHWEHTGTAELVFDNVAKTNLNRVKHGIYLRARYQYIHRVGYGTFADTAGTTLDDSDITDTQKRYAQLGLYYNFPFDINLQVDANGAWHTDVDRNNSDQIGSYSSEVAVLPGYFFGEFYHNKYAIGKFGLGFPLLPFWDTRLQPAFNILYMPRENDVIGAPEYERRTYRSFSVQLSTKLANVLPVFIHYAYGMDARRYNADDQTEEDGNHEICVLLVMAFGQRQ